MSYHLAFGWAEAAVWETTVAEVAAAALAASRSSVVTGEMAAWRQQ